MNLNEVDIRRMLPSEAEIVAEVDSYAYQNDPHTVMLHQSNREEARKKREKGLISMYTNNPQETFVAVHGGKIIGLIRSFPCSGVFKNLSYSEGEYEHFTNSKIEDLSYEQRRKWWYMTMKVNDLNVPHSHVGPFAVLPEFQGKGVGSKLMEDYLSRLEGISYFETGTKANSLFYENRGFKHVKTVEEIGLKFIFMRYDK